jgi:membrane protein YqaA with SNARE-associated domain
MVIWNGWGVLGFLLFALAWTAADSLQSHVLKPYGSYGAAAVLLLGGIANWFIGEALNRPLHTARWRDRHSLFWIPMEWWSLVFIGMAIAFAADAS